MNDDVGRLIASGRAADVFDPGDGSVVRRYRSERDAELEGRVMRWLADQGIPVPKVRRADGNDLVMDRIDGPTMMADLERRPWRLLGHARTLAALQRELNRLSAPAWFPRHPLVPDHGQVVHLDLHPMNIMFGAMGPTIIDWTNAASGDPSFDAAMTHVLISSFEVTGRRDRAARRLFVSAFTRSRGRAVVRSGVADACLYRLGDANTTAGEREAVERLLRRAVSRTPPDRVLEHGNPPEEQT